MVKPLTDYVITPHAASEMQRRGIGETELRTVLATPLQRLEVRLGRVVFHGLVVLGSPAKTYLVRVFVDLDRQPAEVVMAYRTSKVGKYWREEQ